MVKFDAETGKLDISMPYIILAILLAIFAMIAGIVLYLKGAMWFFGNFCSRDKSKML